MPLQPERFGVTDARVDSDPLPSLPSLLLEQADLQRRRLGELLDLWGWTPLESAHRLIASLPGVDLIDYGGDGGDAVLVVPAPIKSAWVWDMLPQVSAVGEYLRRGLRVFMARWQSPDRVAGQLGLMDYADRLLLACVESVREKTGTGQVYLTAHSLGGTLAAIFTALHPDAVKGLTLIGAPLNFGAGIGVFASAAGSIRPDEVPRNHHDNVPGSFLTMFSAAVAPMEFGWSRWADWWQSLPSPLLQRIHGLIERWTLDEVPLARRAFLDIVGQLYRENRFTRGTLTVGGRRSLPRAIACPVLAVVDPQCGIAPPAAVEPFLEKAGSGRKQIMWYEEEPGVAIQHLGTLVGPEAHRRLWPAMLSWMHGA